MKRIFSNIFVLFALLIIITPGWSQDTGMVTVPAFTGADVHTEIVLDSSTGLYTYYYTITNPASNTGEIWDIDIDIRRPQGGRYLSSDGLTIPRGGNTQTFDEVLAIRRTTELMVPVGILAPAGWNGSVEARGFASISARTGTPNILPGETKCGFQLISRGLPAIREVEIEPWWVFRKEGAISDSDEDVARATTKSLKFTTKTIGPTAPVSFGPNRAIEMLHNYIDESVTLGWASDPALVNDLLSKLYAAQQAIDTDNPSQAKLALAEFINLIEQSSTSQLTSEAKGLLLYNAQQLINDLPDTYIPPVEILELRPEEATYPIGTLHILTATYTEIRGSVVRPLAGYQVELKIVAGPNEGMVFPSTYTNGIGQAVFTYTGTIVGTDKLVAITMSELEWMTESNPVYVTWTGGPDLVIPYFIPPIIKTKGGNSIFISDITENIGNANAGPSITRYYISEDSNADPTEDIVIGQRNIPALVPGESNESIELEFQLPISLSEGTYYCGACADADKTIFELNEENNCEINKNSIVTPFDKIPICIDDLAARSKSGKVQLTWTHQEDADCYNIYRSTDPDVKYLTDNLIAECHVTTYSTYLDTDVVNGIIYYYAVSKIFESNEVCFSNEVNAVPTQRIRR